MVPVPNMIKIQLKIEICFKRISIKKKNINFIEILESNHVNL